jgi:hypothetical protein
MIMSQLDLNPMANKSIEEKKAMLGAKVPTFKDIVES